MITHHIFSNNHICYEFYCVTASNATHSIAKTFLSVCLSVHLSIKRVLCDETKENCAQILIPHEISFVTVFRQEEWLVGDDPLYLKFWV